MSRFENRAVPDQATLHEIARATRLREGPAGVLAMLRAVHRSGSLRLQEAARQARLPLPVATAVRRELEKAGLLERKHGLSLTEEGRRFVEDDLGMAQIADATCPACGGRGIVVPADHGALVEQFAAIVSRAPAPDVAFDQAPCTPETAILRALTMLQTGALEGRRVLVLGDDDCIAIAIGLLGRALNRRDLTRGVVVADADARWLSFLREVADAEGLALETLHHDLRQPLPAALNGAFDSVETDPPYTLEGVRLFLTRAAEAMAGSAGGQCFLSFAQWPPVQQLQLQQVFVELGFAVQAVRPGFNRYAGAAVLGNVGQLIELVAVAAPRDAAAPWQGALYTADINPRVRAYICADCGDRVVLGEHGAPATIEALKAVGCRVCRGRTFRRQIGASPAAASATASALGSAAAAMPRSPAESSMTTRPQARIRNVEPRDFDVVAGYECEIAKISFPDDPITDIGFYVRKVEKIARDADAAGFVAESDDGLIGWACVSTRQNFITKEPYADFHSIYLSPSARGSGVVAQLVQAVFEFCRERKLDRAVFRTRATNEPMKAVLARYGFVPTQMYYEKDFTGADDEVHTRS
jgi:hypothetical protein